MTAATNRPEIDLDLVPDHVPQAPIMWAAGKAVRIGEVCRCVLCTGRLRGEGKSAVMEDTEDGWEHRVPGACLDWMCQLGRGRWRGGMGEALSNRLRR